MGAAITIRDVPEQTRDEPAAGAARAGHFLQGYLQGMLIEAAARPAQDDVITRARARVAATGVTVSSETILAARHAERR